MFLATVYFKSDEKLYLCRALYMKDIEFRREKKLVVSFLLWKIFIARSLEACISLFPGSKPVVLF